MAQVIQGPQLRERIDGYLDPLVSSWQGIAVLAEGWATWDEDSRLNFDPNWAVPEDRLAQLRDWSARGRLDARQLARLARLESLVTAYRPLLTRLPAE